MRETLHILGLPKNININSYSRLVSKSYVKTLNVKGQCAWVVKRFFSTHQRLNKEHPNNKHSYSWLVGLTDGAGCFIVKNLKGHWYFIFKLIVPRYNIRMLYYVKHLLGIGSVIKDSTKAQFIIKDKIKIKNFVFLIFDRYPLLTNKRFIYEKFKEAYFILDNNNLTKEEKDSNISNLELEIINMETIQDVTHSSFLNCTNGLINAITKSWVVGFIEVRGMFYLERSATSLGIVNVFRIQTSDGVVLEALRSIFHIPNKVKCSEKYDYYILETANSRAIQNIINILQGEFKGMKALSFKLWSRGYLRRDNEIKITKIQSILQKTESNLSYSLGCGAANYKHNTQNRFIGGSLHTQKRKFSSTVSVPCCNLNNVDIKLNPFYVTGFTDAEGSFIISLSKRSYSRIGWSVRAHFQIVINSRDLMLLKNIQNFFGGVGNISNSETRDTVSFTVSSFKEINQSIIPHFNSYKLLTNKQADFELFKQALEVVNKGEHLNYEGLTKIAAIRASINTGKVSEEFANNIPVIRPEVINTTIIDPNWLIGFIEGEGCFYVGIIKSDTHKIGSRVKVKFVVSQHIRDLLLIKSFVSYLDCGTITSQNNACYFSVNKLLDIEQKIIPFIRKNPLYGVKLRDFEDFCKVVQIVNNKEHLTPKGLEEIKKIKSGMNRGRK